MTDESRREYAAIDLGSNSFHMVIAREDAGQLRVIDRIREPVSLGSGLNEHNELTHDVQARARNCLALFAQRLRGLDSENVRAVGTKTLRRARNAPAFINEAESVLGHPIDIVSGQEEARLIYHGVRASGELSGKAPHLVLDIGGASTEIAVGDSAEADITESISAGCVAITRTHFANGRLTASAWHAAVNDVLVELRPLFQALRRSNWRSAIGCSGSMKAIAAHLQRQGVIANGTITQDALLSLRSSLLGAGSVDGAEFDGLSDARRQVFAGGTVVLTALFEALSISELTVSQAALREGVLYELFGRTDENVQRQTVSSLQIRFGIDVTQANRADATLARLLSEVASFWNLPARLVRAARQAARLHEIGLVIAHSQYHKHGEMLLRHAELPGFSHQQQEVLASLVRLQRRRLSTKFLPDVAEPDKQSLIRLAVLLRISLVLCRDRQSPDLELLRFRADFDSLTLEAPRSWFDANPLTRAELLNEQRLSEQVGMKIEIRSYTQP